jgi:RNA polymerase sigma-70 factor (ECF subfamily)
MNETPLSLLERLRQSPDDASWRRLFDLYTPVIHGWLQRQGLSSTDADDVAQEISAAIVRDLPSFDHSGRRGAFRLWVRTITLHHLRNFWRSQRPVAGPLAPSLDELEDPESDLSRLWDREHDELVARRLMALIEPDFSPNTWRSFRSQVIDGHSAAEVAAAMGLSINAVLIAKSRVLRKFRHEARGLLDETC